MKNPCINFFKRQKLKISFHKFFSKIKINCKRGADICIYKKLAVKKRTNFLTGIWDVSLSPNHVGEKRAHRSESDNSVTIFLFLAPTLLHSSITNPYTICQAFVPSPIKPSLLLRCVPVNDASCPANPPCVLPVRYFDVRLLSNGCALRRTCFLGCF